MAVEIWMCRRFGSHSRLTEAARFILQKPGLIAFDNH